MRTRSPSNASPSPASDATSRHADARDTSSPSGGPAASPGASGAHLPLQSFQQSRRDGALPASLHEAVAHQDIDGVRALIGAGAKLNKLDTQRRTPLDVLDTLGASRSVGTALRRELLRPRNPAAPDGHSKPEALHGSPWGFEILESKALAGGRHAPKGGHSSLEGMVFFSTRTPESATSQSVRGDWRGGPRRYAKGSASSSNSPAQAGIRYQLASAVLERAGSAASWQPTADPQRYDANTPEELAGQLAQELRTAMFVMAQRTPANNAEALGRSIEQLPLRASVLMCKPNGERVRIDGDALRTLYRDAAADIKHQQEHSDSMPYLCLMNRGQIVPVVFGFEKVEGLRTHTLASGKQHAYQEAVHPLAGSEQGGRLTEIEVGSREDLATLSLACLSRGIEIPPDAVVRINPPPGEKRTTGARAAYLNAQQVQQFHATLAQQVSAHAGVAPAQARQTLSAMPVATLQDVNDRARAWAAQV
ncbi:hypothetical protein [Burkholderia sp. Ac-20379]|uniref:hypothetical protein n=1 Tax=Burkholderia sp. Ac-20379 TaxID=2703900 RepID=UPI001981C793|nr:hypothetical protein [Burkholderia sp. Ac-20379]MBN3724971.1 ankyrin repeat domain-containing protein [Burkholderia sp. Ac-20379]